MAESLQALMGSLLAALVAAAGLGFAWRQWKTLGWLRVQENLAPEDRGYYRWMVARRLCGCVLLLALAVALAGLFGMGILDRVDALVAQGPQARKEGRKLSAEEQRFVFFSMKYVGVIALITLGLLVVALFDVRAIRKFGNRHRKRIRDDRAAMLERQLPLLYKEKRAGLLPDPPADDDDPEPPRQGAANDER
jgi:hypothetical protein